MAHPARGFNAPRSQDHADGDESDGEYDPCVAHAGFSSMILMYSRIASSGVIVTFSVWLIEVTCCFGAYWWARRSRNYRRALIRCSRFLSKSASFASTSPSVFSDAIDASAMSRISSDISSRRTIFANSYFSNMRATLSRRQ